jgi:hypothetical protein
MGLNNKINLRKMVFKSNFPQYALLIIVKLYLLIKKIIHDSKSQKKTIGIESFNLKFYTNICGQKSMHKKRSYVRKESLGFKNEKKKFNFVKLMQ